MRATILIALAAIIFTVCPLSAQKTNRQAERDRVMAELKPYKKKFFIQELKLSKEQATAFMPLYEEMTEKVQTITDETRALERSVMDKEDATDVELEAAARAQFEQKITEGKIELEYYDKFRSILTPKQLLRLKSTERKFNQNLMRQHQKMSRERKEKSERK